MQIVVGIIGIIGSFLIIIYRAPIKHFMGQVEWAERYFGPGGTYTFLLFFALFLFFLSLTIMTGAMDFLFGGFLKSFFGSVK
ncbi:MAG: hypothetical protein V1908_04740 [Candidatus Peregrinibacteria bacterium]